MLREREDDVALLGGSGDVGARGGRPPRAWGAPPERCRMSMPRGTGSPNALNLLSAMSLTACASPFASPARAS